MLVFLLSVSEETEKNKIEYLFRQYHDEMLRFTRSRLRMTGNPNYVLDAEDVVQAAFLKIVKYSSRIDLGYDARAVRGYVYTVLKNAIADFIREQNEFPVSDQPIEEIADTSFLARLQLQERYEEVVDGIRRLDEKYSTVLFYRYVNEMEVREIAEFMGIPEKTVYTRIARGKALLLAMRKEEGCYADT